MKIYYRLKNAATLLFVDTAEVMRFSLVFRETVVKRLWNSRQMFHRFGASLGH